MSAQPQHGDSGPGWTKYCEYCQAYRLIDTWKRYHKSHDQLLTEQ